MELSNEARAVKVQLQEFNQRRRMIRNLLTEKKELLEMCDLLKRGSGVRVDGGEQNSRQEKLQFRLEEIDAKVSELLMSASNTESILLSAMDTLSPTERDLLYKFYDNHKQSVKSMAKNWLQDRSTWKLIRSKNNILYAIINGIKEKEEFYEMLSM